MLNPVFSKDVNDVVGSQYVLPKELQTHVASANQQFNTGPELRTQEVYTNEIWLKLKSLGINEEELRNRDILDICCGTGFLSYHLLKRCPSTRLTLADISKKEVAMAKRLLNGRTDSQIRYKITDVTKTDFKDCSFDFVIGNSFLHHFYDLPQALREIIRILKPGGMFISLHEPKTAAIPLEKASIKEYLKCIANEEEYLDSIRYNGKGEVSSDSGADVWMFKIKEIKKVFIESGFSDVKTANWNIARPYIAEKHKLHLSENKKSLTKTEEQLLNKKIYTDLQLSKFLPEKFFGSFAIISIKPHEN